MKLGKYQLVRKLATGGMAEVYLARAEGPRGFEKELVVKRILPHLAEEPPFVEMFLTEAQLAARLDHPHLVQIFDFGEADGTFYLAMEYIDGPNLRTLGEWAKTAGQELPAAACARIIANACEGLAHAHERTHPTTGEPLQLIHRDLSPDNILVSRQGVVKVVDFGIAKAVGHGHPTRSGMVKGKLAYMPPEQFQGLAPDLRVDVYALGVVLYELLTGRVPFEAATKVDLARAILREQPRPAAEHRPGLAPALQRVLDTALAKDREQRYPDCRALQSDLEHFILSTGEPLGAWQLSKLVRWVSEAAGAEASASLEPAGPEAPREPKPLPPLPVTRVERTPRPSSGPPRYSPPTRAMRSLASHPVGEGRPAPASEPPMPPPVPTSTPRHLKLLVAGAGAALLFALMARVLLGEPAGSLHPRLAPGLEPAARTATRPATR